MKKNCIIREYDFKQDRLQHRYNFLPITVDELKKQITWHSLKSDKKRATIFRHWPYPNEMIKRLGITEVYDYRYKYWLARYNENEELVIRASLGLKESRLGWLKEKVKEHVDAS